jgi:ribosomal protein S27AE
MSTRRPRRATIAGARAQFAGIAADVVNVSCSGALVRASQQQKPGSHMPLVLDLGGTSIPLTARVVRCEPVAGPLKTSTGQFSLALTFVDPPADAVAVLEQVCHNGRRGAVETRRLQVSLARRCPKCHSRDVAKEAQRRYSCCQCGQVFSGFRVGFIRFAR